MILDKTQAELIIEEARIDSPLMQCMLKSIEIKNMIDLEKIRLSELCRQKSYYNALVC